MFQRLLHRNENPVRSKGQMVALYAAAHFLVDFSCAFLMFYTMSGTGQWYLCLLLYNFFAFAMQMPIGLLADKLNRNALCAATGCAMIALAFTITAMPVGAVVVLGTGNALFHVGGGIEILNMSRGKSGPLGIFVSPGAFGIYLGTSLGKQAGFSPVPTVLLLLLAVVFILIMGYRNQRSFISDNLPLSFKNAGSPQVLLIIGCLFAVVCLRSYVGMVLSFPWKGQWHWGIVLICAVVFGKATGGMLADRIGAKIASIFSLGISAVAFLFSGQPLWGVLAIFLFNMTMPITLWAVARALPGAKGFSFGLLTFGLFLGFAPVYLGVDLLINTPIALGMASLVSLLLLLVGLKRAVPT